MWLTLALCSAVLLGLYDVAKKKATENNPVLFILLIATALSTLFLTPCFFIYKGSGMDHLKLVMKAVLVSASWISGMVGLKLLPITTVSTLKTTRPFLVVIFSIILFGEQLNLWQWGGVILALTAVMMLSRTSSSEGIKFSRNKGIWAMGLSIAAGVASALYDKFIMKGMEALFVQSWSNFYITVLLLACFFYQRWRAAENAKPVRWDWLLVLIAVLITAADMLYFFSLKQDGALLSVISLARRSSVIVTFAVGALFFKEKNVKAKSLALAVLLAGMVLLLIGSN
ncbi:MAG: DMT family transporter [Bacteroidales bacterium]|nr:DMT family transporter [Bacteroidales bacterium]